MDPNALKDQFSSLLGAVSFWGSNKQDDNRHLNPSRDDAGLKTSENKTSENKSSSNETSRQSSNDIELLRLCLSLDSAWDEVELDSMSVEMQCKCLNAVHEVLEREDLDTSLQFVSLPSSVASTSVTSESLSATELKLASKLLSMGAVSKSPAFPPKHSPVPEFASGDCSPVPTDLSPVPPASVPKPSPPTVSQLRFQLVPRYLDEICFWRRLFALLQARLLSELPPTPDLEVDELLDQLQSVLDGA